MNWKHFFRGLLIAGAISGLPLLSAASTNSFENFEDPNWPAATTLSSGNKTNFTNTVTGWAIQDAFVYKSASSWTSPSNACVLRPAFGASTIFSPLLSNGVGAVSFQHRGHTTSPGSIITVASSYDQATWMTNRVVTNTVATFTNWTVSIGAASNLYVRLTVSGGDAAGYIDDILVSYPPPVITLSNVVITPSAPKEREPVVVSADVNVEGMASSLTVSNYWRELPGASWNAIPMTTTAPGVYTTGTRAIPGSASGVTNEYFVRVHYASNGIPTSLQSGTNSYIVAPQPGYINRWEPFTDPNWPTAITLSAGNKTNFTNTVTGWAIKDAFVYKSASSWTSPSNACVLRPVFGASTISGPLFSNGIGAVNFQHRGHSTFPGSIITVASSPDNSNWTTNGAVTNSATTFTNWSVNVGSFSNLYVRLTVSGGDAAGYIDDILVTYPPANVLITNVFLNPGYPVAGQTFTASCDVISLNPNFPAYNINPVFVYGASSSTMTRVSSSGATNRYTVAITLPAGTRDTPYTYYVQSAFDGYYGSQAEYDRTRPGRSVTNQFIARAFASPYGSVGAVVNGTTNAFRMVTNGLWQGVVSFFNTNSSFSLTFAGAGYSAGSGYLASNTLWGNTNNWKTTLPLSDFAGTNQGAVTLTGNFIGDYIIRFNEQTGEYLVQQCAWQDFETWTKSAGGLYERSENINFPLVANNFDTWATNRTMVRTDDFSSEDWAALSSYTNYAFGGVQGFAMYSCRIIGAAVQTTTNSVGDSFVVQLARAPTPSSSNLTLRGIGTISFSYSVGATNPPVALAVKGYNGSTNWDAYASKLSWFDLPSNSVATPPNSGSKTLVVNTNATFDVIFSHSNGAQIVTLDNVSVSEWYADSQTNADWITSEGWIEQRSAGNMHCRFDVTRDDGAGQYVMSPVLINGINALTFNYCGASLSPVSFAVEIQYGAGGWSTLTSFTNATTNYTAYSYTVGTSTNNARLRVRNTTPRPGILFVDDFKIGAKVTGLTWNINNASVDDTDPTYPPVARQYYGGAGYLNSNKTSNINTDPIKIPDTNAWPYLLSPKLGFGVGEISFWYRNWATNAPVTPATLVVQTSTLDQPSATNAADWVTAYTLSNIVNIADYQFLQLGFYDTTSKWVRIANDISTNAGRVCLDDILIAAPMAASFAMSNLTVSPLLPLYTNTVDVYVDVYQLFLNPTNITLTALYGAATNYTGLSNASLSSLAMTCVASNLAAPGKWYRYKTSTPIPTNAIDTFVRYGARASWQGYNAQATSPRTNTQFATVPTWYKPLDTLYGTNIPYYIVYSCPTGAVWINEIDYINWESESQFVELCGPAGSRIGNWQLEMLNDSVITTAIYRITNGAILGNVTNGFGFWVLGNTNVTARDQLLTNSIPSSGGLRLIRSCGVHEYAICYSPFQANLVSLINAGFTSLGAGIWDDDWNGDTSIALYGTGSNYQAFVWAAGVSELTPGLPNTNQLFVGASSGAVAPIITIWSFMVDSSVWIACTRTSGWYNTPWYSTNLLNSNLWVAVPVFTNIPNATNDVLSFTRPTNSPAYFYKVVSTNTP
jgi:hypothetical protein